MPVFEPYIASPEEQHRATLWEREEVYRFYAGVRRENCTYLEVMDLWLRAPLCVTCIQSQWWWRGGPPDVSEHDWEDELATYVGDERVCVIKADVSDGRDAEGVPCKGCLEELCPWLGDDIFVDMYHLEEHYGLDLETPGRVQPGRDFRRQVIGLYGNECFSCEATSDLHLDHINPRSHGGDAAFRNLQPLCVGCGNLKGDQLPEEVSVYSDLYFGPLPPDSYEGLFW